MSYQQWTLSHTYVHAAQGRALVSASTPAHPGITSGGVGHLITPQSWVLVLIGVVLVGVITARARGGSKDVRRISKAVAKGMGSKQQSGGTLERALGGLFRALWRFVTGREMNGRAASNAGLFRPGRRPLSVTVNQMPVSQLGSIALPAPPVRPALPPGPSASVSRWRGWVDAHPLPGALNGAVRHTGAAAVWLGGTSTAALRGVAATTGATRRVLKTWGTWPYACRALMRFAVLAAAFGLWRHPAVAELSMAALALVLVLASATGPAGLGLWHSPPQGDDRIYGPALWAAVRVVLGQQEEEYMDGWLHLDSDLSQDGAQIRLALPVSFAGTELERQQLDHLVNTRVPGEWVSRWHLMRGKHFATWTRKPKPKPKPECPDFVDFFDPEIQAAIRACGKGEIVIGRDEHNRIVIRRLTGETAHWALSVGSGGGKSAFNQMVIAQLIRQGYHIVIVDVKRVSLSCYIGVSGCYIYNDPMAPQDMRDAVDWVVNEMEARSAVLEVQPDIDFPGLACFLEEATELSVISKDWWDDNRKATKDKDGPAESAADPMWSRVGTGARLGRQMWASFVLITQDFRDQVFGGKGLRNAFPLKFMGNFNAQQWKNVINTTPVPESYTKAGRMMLVEGAVQQGWVQTCYGSPDALRAWAIQERERTDFDPTAGLFGTPPAPSSKRLPRLLRAASRDKLPEATWKALEGSEAGSVPGGGVTSRSHDVARDALLPAQRDALDDGPSDALPGAGRHRAEGQQDAVASWRSDATDAAEPETDDAVEDVEELLTLAEISRRLEERGITLSDVTMRQHKARRKDGENQFPSGTEVGKKTLYTMAEIVEYYADEIKAQWSNLVEE